jgi:hypothetical protein
MSPTIFRVGPFRFYFFSREESRPHVHVHTPDGEAKFWIDPEIELATSTGMPRHQIKSAFSLIQEHEDEIRNSWDTHFSR